jgi:hypothetical protein
MERFPVMEVGRLVVCADNDVPGRAAAGAVKRRYGERATVWMPREVGEDFADVLTRRPEHEHNTPT